jgi:hypothetical protein
VKDTIIVFVPSHSGAFEVAKWQKPKSSKELNAKIAYGQIKQAEKVTVWKNVAYPGQDALALEKEWNTNRIRMFAKYCWENRGKLTPSKDNSWDELFAKKEGISLINYVTNFVRKKL